MEFLENKVLTDLKRSIEIDFYQRFVDDIIMACAPKDIDLIMTQFNAYHKDISFTVEKENNNKLNFLDMTIHRNPVNGELKTCWYTKQMWSERYLNFLSETAIEHKVGVIYNLIDRAILLSDKEFQNKNIQKVKNVLKINNYPEKFMNKYIKKRICILKNKENIKNNDTKEQNETRNKSKIVAIPYNNEISTKITRLFQKETNSKLAYKNNNTLSWTYSNLKTKISNEFMSGVVYKITCNNCNKVYIGQTQNYLRDRINAHKRSVKNKTYETALSQHATDLNHKFNFDIKDIQIIDKEKNYKKRVFKEMVHICKTKNKLNNNTDTQKLSTLYNKIL